MKWLINGLVYVAVVWLFSHVLPPCPWIHISIGVVWFLVVSEIESRKKVVSHLGADK